MNIGCIILNYNDSNNCIELARKIKAYSVLPYVVVVDNCSTDESLLNLKIYDGKLYHLISTDHNGGYGYGNNFGMKYAFEKLHVDAVLICNPDVFFEENVVERLSSAMEAKPKCGVVSAVQYDRNGNEINQSAWSIPHIWNYIFSVGKLSSHVAINFYQNAEFLHCAPVTKVDCVAGSLLLISRSAFEETGGYDENVFLYCEETILGCKLKEAGFNTYICSDVSYEHLHGVTIAKSIKSSVARKRLLLKSHHYTLINYLHANKFQIFVDKVFIAMAIAEEYIVSFAKRVLPA